MTKYEKAVLGLLGAIAVLLFLHWVRPVQRFQVNGPFVLDTCTGEVHDVGSLMAKEPKPRQ